MATDDQIQSNRNRLWELERKKERTPKQNPEDGKMVYIPVPEKTSKKVNYNIDLKDVPLFGSGGRFLTSEERRNIALGTLTVY